MKGLTDEQRVMVALGMIPKNIIWCAARRLPWMCIYYRYEYGKWIPCTESGALHPTRRFAIPSSAYQDTITAMFIQDHERRES